MKLIMPYRQYKRPYILCSVLAESQIAHNGTYSAQDVIQETIINVLCKVLGMEWGDEC